MVIKNSTSWRTKDLRKLFRRCVREVEKVEQPSYPFHKRNKNFKLDILNQSRNCFRGRATINGYWIMIKIGKDIDWDKPFTEESFIKWYKTSSPKEALAKVMIHEYYHTIGFKDQDRNGYKNDYTRNLNTDWVKDYPIRKKEIVKKELVDHQLTRYQIAIKNLRKAETRLKRAKTLYKKWLKKTKYYETKCGFNPN